MAVDKYLEIQNGVVREKKPLQVSAGAADAGRIPAVGADGRLDETTMPAGIGAEIAVYPASENLAAGDLVNVWDDGGTLKVRKADASSIAKVAHGFVRAVVAEAANATVYLTGINSNLSGLSGGPDMYLATTPGDVTATAPTAAGQVVQRVGVRISETEIGFEAGLPVLLASA